MHQKQSEALSNDLSTIEIDNDEQGVIGNFTIISDIRTTKAEPE